MVCGEDDLGVQEEAGGQAGCRDQANRGSGKTFLLLPSNNFCKCQFQVEDWFKQNKPSKEGEKKKGKIQRKKPGDEKMSRVGEIPKTVEEDPKDVKAKVVTKGEKV